MTAISQNDDTAAHMSYTSNGNGIGMAANRIFGRIKYYGLIIQTQILRMTRLLLRKINRLE